VKESRSLSIRTSLRLAIALTVASVLLAAGAMYGYQLYRSGRYSAYLRTRSIAEAYAAQMAPLVLAPDRSALTTLVRQLRWHPSSCLLAILDDQRQPLASRGDLQLLGPYLKTTASKPTAENPAASQTASSSSVPVPNSSEVTVVTVPILSAETGGVTAVLAYATRLSGNPEVSGRQAWVFFAGLLMAAVAGVAMGTWYLKSSVLRPLAALSSKAKEVRMRRPQTTLPTERSDEIGELAKVLTDLNMDVEDWRRRTSEMQRNFARTVDSQKAEITRELHQAQRKAWTDPLTRLGNRLLLEDKLDGIFAQQKQTRQDLVFVMYDVDNFKMLNDTLGHQAGDELLKFMGELLKQCVRKEDLAVRYGGDEFILVLPGVAMANAQSIAERTVRLFSQQANLLAVSPKPTISAGIASLADHQPASADELMRMADKALYAAKNAGKFTVAIHGQAVPLSPTLKNK